MRAVIFAGFLCVVFASTIARADGVVTRVSVSAAGGDATGDSLVPALSADGRYVAFASYAPDLTSDDGDTIADVFVYDRVAHTTTLVSKSTTSVKGDRDSGDPFSYGRGGPAISADGRFVAFTSMATNLVPGDGNATTDVFVHDRDADGNGIFDEPGGTATVRVSVSTDDEEANSYSQFPAISADGRFVAFASFASNLVPGDTNGQRDVFVRDRDPDGNGIFDEPGHVATTRVSVTSGGVEGDGESGRPDLQISADGRYVAFLSDATNLVAGDDNHVADVFVHDTASGVTERVNVSSSGHAPAYWPTYDFALSGDGRWVAFSSQDPSMAADAPGYGGVSTYGADVFVHDRVTGITTTWAENAPAGQRPRDESRAPVLSYDGGVIAFQTRFGHAAYDGGTEHNSVEVYTHDRRSGTTATRPLLASDGAPTTVLGRGIAISGDGRVVAYDTEGALLDSDRNGKRDVFTESCPVVVAADPRFQNCEPIPFTMLIAGESTRFATGAAEFQHVDGPEDGLGPVFNEATCVACHDRPWVGGTSDRRVTRIGTYGVDGFDPLIAHGGGVIQTQGIATAECTVDGEVVPPEATVVTERDPLALFGLGIVDALDDRAILRFADPDDANHNGISGRPNMVNGRVGRFGRKAQIATLHEFAGDAYLQEMGITSPDFPIDLAPQGVPSCDPVPDPEDDGTNVARFVDFIALLAPLPSGRYPTIGVRREAHAGRSVFKRIGCTGCHTDRLKLPKAVLRTHGVRKFAFYSDFLLHDMGPGLADGIVQGDATGSEYRTPPLAGVAFTAPYLHDGRAATLDDAILAHDGEAARTRAAFAALSATDRAAVRAFLGTL